MTVYYKSSKGPVEIASMPLRYAVNALGKLRREYPERSEEIDAISKRVEYLEADSAPPVGHNGAPEELKAAEIMSWDDIKLHMDSLLEQVEGISGVEITDSGMAADNAKLLRDVQKAIKDADESRDLEKKPFSDKVNEIQARFNTYTAPIKNKAPGLLSKAEVALKNQAAAWLRKQAELQRQREDAARAEADKIAEEARKAHLEALRSEDMDSFSAADEMLSLAEDAQKILRSVEKDKASVKVEGARAVTLRTVWRAQRIPGEGNLAFNHYAKAQTARVIAFLDQLAAEDVRAGVRSIPGYNVISEQVV